MTPRAFVTFKTFSAATVARQVRQRMSVAALTAVFSYFPVAVSYCSRFRLRALPYPTLPYHSLAWLGRTWNSCFDLDHSRVMQKGVAMMMMMYVFCFLSLSTWCGVVWCGVVVVKVRGLCHDLLLMLLLLPFLLLRSELLSSIHALVSSFSGCGVTLPFFFMLPLSAANALP